MDPAIKLSPLSLDPRKILFYQPGNSGGEIENFLVLFFFEKHVKTLDIPINLDFFFFAVDLKNRKRTFYVDFKDPGKGILKVLKPTVCQLDIGPGQIKTIEDLQEHLQIALELEFFTIPPYLAAMYSIQDPASNAYQVIRSIVLEEMLHMNLVSNLLNGTGKTPVYTGSAVPVYPNYLPHHAAGGPYVGLMPLTREVLERVFMVIEVPAPLEAPAESNDYQTIGQFYKSIEDGFRYCVKKYGADQVFQDNGYQQINYYIGSGGGKAIFVQDLESASLAINQIVEQGEGSPNREQTFVPKQKWGTYNGYGMRNDGTYGPILGTPTELSHYFKFQAIAGNPNGLPSVYPMVGDPKSLGLQLPPARADLSSI